MICRIETAAIMDGDTPFTRPRPARHGNLINALARMGRKTPITGEQGFMTDDGRFVDRVTGMLIARAAGQLLPLERRPWGEKDYLFSEDLW